MLTPLLGALLLITLSDGPRAPYGLLVELLRAPDLAVITDPEPEFSWIVNDARHGATQSAYRILVAASETASQAGQGDVWDSGRVDSDRSVAVTYAGTALEPHRSYWWRVQTWDGEDVASPLSAVQHFRTGSFDRSGEAFPGASAWVRLEGDRWVLENRQRAEYVDIPPATFAEHGPGHYVADFRRAAFATLRVTLSSEDGGDTVLVYLGERRTDNGLVHKNPGRSNIGFKTDTLITHAGTHTYQVDLPRHRANYPNSQVLPAILPEVTPFRYAELAGAPGAMSEGDIRQVALLYPFDDEASTFESANPALDEVWDLCRYTLQATPFLSLYCDGNRERMPYEADAYIQQLGHYNVDRELAVARYTNQFLLYNPSWPTEWHMHAILAAWEDYLHSGDDEFLKANYDLLKAKTLIALTESNGLISTRTGKATPEYLASLHYTGTQFRDIVDWPHGTPPGAQQAGFAGPLPTGETDGYVFTDFNTVVNAFHYRTLVLMEQIAASLGHPADAAFYAGRAEAFYRTFNASFFDPDRGVYVDGPGTDHAALHANMVPLAFGLVPEEHVPGVVAHIKSRGMACSVYGAQYLLEALYAAGEADYALSLMTSDDRRSWRNMRRVGSTMTTEAWDEFYKPNLTWNHAWGAAPGNIIPRRLMGIEPIEPGYAVARIKPQPGSLHAARAKVPTIRGPISAAWTVEGEVFHLDITLPATMRAEVWLPHGDPSALTVGDRPLLEVSDLQLVGREGAWTVVEIPSGTVHFAGPAQKP